MVPSLDPEKFAAASKHRADRSVAQVLVDAILLDSSNVTDAHGEERWKDVDVGFKLKTTTLGVC